MIKRFAFHVYNCEVKIKIKRKLCQTVQLKNKADILRPKIQSTVPSTE